MYPAGTVNADAWGVSLRVMTSALRARTLRHNREYVSSKLVTMKEPFEL